jgi:hypothetical protein
MLQKRFLKPFLCPLVPDQKTITNRAKEKVIIDNVHCKKRLLFFPGIKFFLARESLASDIPAGGGKNDNLFYSVV